MSQGRGGSQAGKRPTKAEKREEGRRQREEIQRRAARRRHQRALVVGVAIGLAAIVVAVVAFTGGGTSHSNAPGDLLARATDEAKAASCTPVNTIPPFDPANVSGDVAGAQAVAAQGDGTGIDRDHIGSQYDPGPPPLSAYQSVPPTSGPHDGNPLPAGVYDAPPDVHRAIHSLEHGATIVWYSPNAPSGLVDELVAFYGKAGSAVGQDRVIVAPYDYPSQDTAGSLPNGVQMAVVAWHHLQTCGEVNLAVAFDFTSQYSAPPYGTRKYLGDAPEAGNAF